MISKYGTISTNQQFGDQLRGCRLVLANTVLLSILIAPFAYSDEPPPAPLLSGNENHFSRDKNNPLTYALEIEFDPDRFDTLFKFYDVVSKKEKTTLDPKTFKSAGGSVSVRDLVKLQEVELVKKASGPIKAPGQLHDEKDHQFYQLLPEKLYNEGSGTVELNEFKLGTSSGQIESLKQVKDLLNKTKERIGEGDVQGHIVFNRPNPQTLKDHPFRGTLGYTIYEHDRALLGRFQEEYLQHQRDPSYIPAVNLNSRALPPMNQTKVWAVDQIEKHLNTGELDDTAQAGKGAMPVIRTSRYQPNGKKVGFELRMYDNPSEAAQPYQGSFEHLFSSMDRLNYHLTQKGTLADFLFINGENTFIPPGNEYPVERGADRADWLCKTIVLPNHWKWHNRAKDASLPLKECHQIRSTVREVESEVRANGGEQWNANEKKSKKIDPNMVASIEEFMTTQAKASTRKECRDFAQRFRSLDLKFMFPLRNWDEHPVILDGLGKAAHGEKKRLAIQAQSQSFFDQFNGVLCDDKPLNQSQIEEKLRILVAEWAKSTNLFEYFEKFENEKLFLTESPAFVSGEKCLGRVSTLNLEKTCKQVDAILSPLGAELSCDLRSRSPARRIVASKQPIQKTLTPERPQQGRSRPHPRAQALKPKN